MRMTLIRAWIALGLASAGLVTGIATAVPARPPNIVYILANDPGYGDLVNYGQKLIRTPRLDQMAREGMRLTQHYSGAPSCAPARCVLMTGKHTGLARIRANSDRPILPEDATVTEVLKATGYATSVFERWGLGLEDSTVTQSRKGVDETSGATDNARRFRRTGTDRLFLSTRLLLVATLPMRK